MNSLNTWVASAVQGDTLIMVIDAIKEVCVADANGNYALTDMMEAALSLRRDMDTNAAGFIRTTSVASIDTFMGILMGIASKTSLASRGTVLVKEATASHVPKPVPLKKSKKHKHVEKEHKESKHAKAAASKKKQ